MSDRRTLAGARMMHVLTSVPRGEDESGGGGGEVRKPVLREEMHLKYLNEGTQMNGTQRFNARLQRKFLC